MQDRIRWDGKRRGWYEAYFLLLNNPAQDLALWLRWLLLVPRAATQPPAITQWAMLSAGGRPVFVQRESVAVPWPDFVQGLVQGQSRGQIGQARLQWRLQWTPAPEAVPLYPYPWMYRVGWPRTKVCAPGAKLAISGELQFAGQQYMVERAAGYLGHLWGTQMASAWAWAQCNHFAGHPEAHFEALSARLAVGPATTPPLTLARLSVAGEEYRFDRPLSWLQRPTQWDAAHWDFAMNTARHQLVGRLAVPTASPIGVTYTAPDASRRYCYHSDLADLALELRTRARGAWTVTHQLHATRCARFESVGRDPVAALRLHL